VKIRHCAATVSSFIEQVRYSLKTPEQEQSLLQGLLPPSLGIEGIFMETVLTSPLYAEAGFDCNRRLYNDATTMLAEALDGHMRTPFEYAFNGEDLIANDGSSLTQVFEDSLADAQRVADERPELIFEPRRRQHERDELSDMIAMARGEAPNTMVVVSDFPPELMSAQQDVGGYNVTRKQTMLRVLVWQENCLKVYSQSLDGSNRQALEAIYTQCGAQPQPGELLAQRLHIDLSKEEQEEITDQLTTAYDESLVSQYGGEWHAGRRPKPNERPVNTYEFVLAQHDLVHHVMDCHRTGTLDSAKVYNVTALLEKRLNEYAMQTSASEDLPSHMYASPFVNLQEDLLRAGREALAEGKVFSACGITIERQAELSASEQLAQAGYGNNDEGPCEFISKKCPSCGTKNVRTVRTKTSISGSCGCTKKL
jgi:hypothetical protein